MTQLDWIDGLWSGKLALASRPRDSDGSKIRSLPSEAKTTNLLEKLNTALSSEKTWQYIAGKASAEQAS
jgi:hypothetical protein